MERLSPNWLAALVAAVCLLTAAWQLMTRVRPAYVPVVVDRQPLTVSIGGAVVRPGLYELPWGSVVADLIEAAGGLAAGAAGDMVQPARPLGQGDTVLVPHEVAEGGGDRISLNAADSLELQRLPGVGPAIASRIISARPYSSVEELLEVSGIGPVTFARIEPLVRP